MPKDHWDLLRAGRSEEGIFAVQQEFRKEPDASTAMELCAVFMWAGRLQSAWEHVCAFNAAYPLCFSSLYGMAGAAKWCMNDPEEAVRQWQIGLRCEFADAGVSIRLPLLLFMASVVRNAETLKASANELLKKCIADPRSESWPGPLARFALGLWKEDRLRKACISTLDNDRKDEDTAINNWDADFYTGVIRLARGDRRFFREAMTQTANVTWDDYDSCKGLFLGKLWREEFFIARHESTKGE